MQKFFQVDTDIFFGWRVLRLPRQANKAHWATPHKACGAYASTLLEEHQYRVHSETEHFLYNELGPRPPAMRRDPTREDHPRGR